MRKPVGETCYSSCDMEHASVLSPLPVAVAAVPDWSGLDAVYYNGFIPPQDGTLITQVPLDPGCRSPVPEPHTASSTPPSISTINLRSARARCSFRLVSLLWWLADDRVGTRHRRSRDDCTPSAQPRGARDNEYLTHWLDQGYAVVGTTTQGWARRA